MNKNSLSYEIGVLMAMSYKENNQSLFDCASSILISLEDDEIEDTFLIEGIKNEIGDLREVNKEEIITEILNEYELNLLYNSDLIELQDEFKFDEKDPYALVCLEEIYEAINSIELPTEDENFLNDIEENLNKASKELALELYNSREAKDAFNELSETAQLIVNKSSILNNLEIRDK